MRPLALRRVFAATRPLTTSSSSSPSPSSTSAASAAQHMLDTFANKTLTRTQTLDANQLQKLLLTLNRPTMHNQNMALSAPLPGTPIPPAHHLIYFTPSSTESALGPDGTDTTFNAPAPFTRRMWAGGSISWTGDSLRVGDPVTEHTRLLSAVPKQSKAAGEMVLVEVEKQFTGPRGASITDTRSWIFRREVGVLTELDVPRMRIAGPTTIVDSPAATGAYPTRQLTWSPVGLFRFSALTFNGHRIHYDAGWSQSVEGHRGIVVHGPLNLINMLDYWGDVHGESPPRSITYRAMAPLYAGDTYTISTTGVSDGKVFDIVAEREGTVCMKAQITGS